MPTLRPAAPRELTWLDGELDHWRTQGWLDAESAESIRSGYQPTTGFTLNRLLLSLGSGFLGIGLIWLVAANLDQLSPGLRFGLATAFWLATTVGAEWLAGRRAHDEPSSPLVGAARIVASLALGAVVFQGAQSLQVPAYEPRLVGLWGLGLLTYAYAVRAIGPLSIGIGLTLGWYLWLALPAADSDLTVTITVLAPGVIAAGLAGLHRRRLPTFAVCWRGYGALLLLAGVFVAALPWDGDGHRLPISVGIAAGFAVVLAVTGVLSSRGRERLEPTLAVAFAGAGTCLSLWAPADEAREVTAGGVSHAIAAVLLYVLVAAGIAALGVLDDDWRLTALATVALVLFTTVQSFAVFARIIEGAWLFVALGAVFLLTGYLFDRARRRLARSLNATPEGAIS